MTKVTIKNKTHILVAFLLLVIPLEIQAARVYFEPSGDKYKVGDNVPISIFVDTENESINAVELGLNIPKLLRIKDISKNGSIIQLWIQEPSYSENTVQLIGGIPSGIKTTKGLIGKIYLEASAIGQGSIGFLPNSSVLLNDGNGTKLNLQAVNNGLFEIIPKPKNDKTPVKETESPKQETKKDTKKPNKFQIITGMDPRVFGGKNFVSFFTTDSDSGVDHYEIKLGEGPFKIAQAPYLIDGIGSRTVIKVRAHDNSGNFREAVYPGILKRLWWSIINIFSQWITPFHR